MRIKIIPSGYAYGNKSHDGMTYHDEMTFKDKGHDCLA